MLKQIKYISLFILLLSSNLLFAQQSVRLNNNWEFLKQDLGGVWEAVRPVGAGNPDVNYYQGPAWYRTNLKIENPYQNGRTILHFEGAGQKTEVYVYTTKVAVHVGGYDEWTVDITDAVAAFQKTAVYQKQFKGKVPVSVRTDNSRDLEMIPSNLSDFNVYGGIYRYLNLVYAPPLSVDKMFAKAEVDAQAPSDRADEQRYPRHTGSPGAQAHDLRQESIGRHRDRHA